MILKFFENRALGLKTVEIRIHIFRGWKVVESSMCRGKSCTVAQNILTCFECDINTGGKGQLYEHLLQAN